MNTVLNNIPSIIELTNKQQAIHQDYVSLFGVLVQLQGSNPDSAQVIILQGLAQNDGHYPGAFSRNLLIAANLLDYDEPIVLPEAFKSSEIIPDLPVTSNRPYEAKTLNVFPNPANDYMVVDYNTKGKTGNIIIVITNMNGQSVYQKSCTSSRDQVVVTTKEWQNGVYVISLYVNGKIIKNKKVTIN